MTDVAAPSGVPAPVSASPAIGARPLTAAGVVLIAAGAAAWTTAVGALAVWRHTQFLSHRFDLGNMVQAVWSTTQGRLLETTDGVEGDYMVRLGAHVDPILLLYVPLWLAHPGPETLIVAQAAALATGIYPVVRLALKYTGSRLAAGLLGAWYFTIPWIVWLGFNEANPLGLALPLLLYAIWYLDEHRFALFSVFAVLALLTGELIGLTVAALGVWYAVRYRRLRPGIGIAVAGIAWTAVCLTVVIPAFNDGRSSRFYDRFESVGGSPTGLVKTVFTDPGAILAQVTTSGDLQYVLWLAAPTALLFLGQPLLLLAAAPQLGVNVLSEFAATVSPLYHYSAPVLAVLVAASIMTIGHLPDRVRVAAASAPLVLSVVLLVSVPPTPGTEQYLFASLETPARTAAMRHAVGLVPPAAPVMATNRLGAHLSARRSVHLFPQEEDADWAVVDTRDRSNDRKWIGQVGFPLLVERLHRDPAWRLVFESEGVRVYRRVDDRVSASGARAEETPDG